MSEQRKTSHYNPSTSGVEEFWLELGGELLADDKEKEGRVRYEIPPPEAARLTEKAGKPLKPQSLEGRMGPFDIAGVKIKDSADRTDELYVQAIFILVDPLFLLRRSHADPKDIRCSLIYRLYHLPLVLFGKFRLERRRICPCNGNVREIRMHLLFNLYKIPLSRPEEKISPSLAFVQGFAQTQEDVHARDPLPDAATQDLRGQNDTDTVGHYTEVSVTYGNVKRCVFPGYFKRVGIGTDKISRAIRRRKT